MMIRSFITVFVFILIHIMQVSAGETRLLRNPDISKEHITFVYANDIWLADRDGNNVIRLTTYPGTERDPHFSPDGKMIAFTGEYDGNVDVYVIPVEGGEPRRLTWHPAADFVRGWSRDGKRIIFASNRGSAPVSFLFKFWSIGLDEAMPAPLPVPRVIEGKFSPDEQKIVYQKIAPWESEWRNYRGGQNNPIRIFDLKTLETKKLPWDGANDKNPVWIGETVYFLSDRDYAMNVWSFNTVKNELKQITFFKEFDCKNLESGDGQLIFENGGYLYVLNPAGGKPQKLSVTVEGDFPWSRPHWKKVNKFITTFALSPHGKRAVFEARGEIFTVPAEKGDVRNLTSSSGSAERRPAWSPDGKHISWFSDEGGEYHLVIADQYGENARIVTLENPTFYYTPRWSPDSKYLSFSDADRNLWLLNIETGEQTYIDNEGFANPERTLYPEWSPDSRWIAYTRQLDNQFNAIFLYSLDKKKSFRLTDGLSDCKSPAWDASGKYLYFLSSTDYGLNVGWLDLSSLDRPVRRAVYVAVLSADEPSPLLPESDEETAEKENGEKKDEDEDKDKNKQPEVKIDFDGIDQRILALNLPERDYRDLQTGKEGTVFYLEAIQNEQGLKLHRYTLKDREAKDVVSGVQNYTISHDGEKLLYSTGGGQWFIAGANGEVKAGEGKIKTDEMQMRLNPLAEWKQIFREAWRYQRDYFYVDNVHGLDLEWAFKTYAPWVDYVRHRDDLTYVLDIFSGETAVGHSFVRGGDYPEVEKVPVGMLGADFEVANGRYRIKKIYTGENWNPDLRAPLSSPGIDVKEGDYLLAVNGAELTGKMNLYSLFDQTAGKQTRITVNSKPSLSGAREVTVVPVANENALRRRDWIESNRRKVDKMSGGKLAYVWLPNTSVGGYKSFNRYYFAQMDKKGAVIDERFNTGGFIADYIIDLMARELAGYFNNPIGDRKPFRAPNAALYGPKVMIINEMAGSGGDMMPYMFRQRKIGPLVGTRTWGGLVGIWDVPLLIDGGLITAPRGGFYNLKGEWDVENKGVAPDIEVDQDPKQIIKGHDPQLEKAVQIALELLKEKEVKILPQPADPVRVKRPE